MKFLFRSSRPLDPARSRACAVDAWNTAAGRVWSRWDAFLAAPESRRRRAYEAYLAALDAEEAAAQRLAEAGVSMAA